MRNASPSDDERNAATEASARASASGELDEVAAAAELPSADEAFDTDALVEGFEPSPVPEGFKRLEREAEAEIRRNGLVQFYGLRRMWSGWLIGWVSALILFQIVLTFSIGLGLLDYTEYDWFLPLVTAQNFLQIVGMAIVVVRFLHSGTKAVVDDDRF